MAQQSSQWGLLTGLQMTITIHYIQYILVAWLWLLIAVLFRLFNNHINVILKLTLHWNGLLKWIWGTKERTNEPSNIVSYHNILGNKHGLLLFWCCCRRWFFFSVWSLLHWFLRAPYAWIYSLHFTSWAIRLANFWALQGGTFHEFVESTVQNILTFSQCASITT